MNALYCAEIVTRYGKKSIQVVAQNILDFDEEIDILTTSAFLRAYGPTPGTMFAALASAGIRVNELAQEPLIDLRLACDVWLSKRIIGPDIKIRRVGCVEMGRPSYYSDGNEVNQSILTPIKAYFQMLDVAALSGVKMNTIAMPLLGAGSQGISGNLTMTPLLNECVEFLKRTEAVDRIIFIDKNQHNAFQFAQLVSGSYSIISEKVQMKEKTVNADQKSPVAFISYASPDQNIADNLCTKLEMRGVKVWYAPRNVHGDYATAIATAIKNSTHFIVILSENSMRSQHVLNEIDLAFKGLPDRIAFKPLRIDYSEFSPAFDYYLSRQHWMDAQYPPLEQRLSEFVDELIEESQ